MFCVRYQLTQKEKLYHLCSRTNWAHMIVSIIVKKPIAQYISLRIALEGQFLSSRSKSIVSRFCVRYERTLKSSKESPYLYLYFSISAGLKNEETCQIDKSSSFSSLQDGFYSYAQCVLGVAFYIFDKICKQKTESLAIMLHKTLKNRGKQNFTTGYPSLKKKTL